jgi:hypothetical protein
MELLRQPSDAPGAAPKGRRAEVGACAKHLLRAPEEPAQDAHPIAEEAAIGRIGDVRLDHRAVDPELPAAGHCARPRQRHHPLSELLDGFRPDEVGPADERGVVRDRRQVDAAELAQDQAVGDAALGLRVAPAIEPLDHQQAQDHLDGGAVAAPGRGVRIPLGQIGFDPLDDRVLVEQAVQLPQFWLEVGRQFRHQRKQVHGRVAIDYHGGEASGSVVMVLQLHPTPEGLVLHRKLVLAAT